MSGQYCENYDVKRETGHSYREMLTAVARDQSVQVEGGLMLSLDSVRPFFKICFCSVLLSCNKSLMVNPLGNNQFCFPRISIIPLTSSRETLRF